MITIQIKEKNYLIFETLARRNGVALSGSAQWIDGGDVGLVAMGMRAMEMEKERGWENDRERRIEGKGVERRWVLCV